MTKSVHHATRKAADKALAEGAITEQAHAAVLAGEVALATARNVGAEGGPTDTTPDSGGRGTAQEMPGRASASGADAPQEHRRPCLCGCRKPVRGKKSMFRAGHDAKLRSELVAQIKKGDVLLRSERITPEQRRYAVERGLVGPEALPEEERHG